MRTAYSVPGQRHGTLRSSDHVQRIESSIDLHINTKKACPTNTISEAQVPLMAASIAEFSPACFVSLLRAAGSLLSSDL